MWGWWRTCSRNRRIRSFLRDCSGNVTVLVTVAMPVILGSVGLGTEAASLMLKHQQMQAVADMAAYSAAVAKAAGSANVTSQARAIASSGGFTDGSGGTSVIVNQPPSAGPFAGNSG